MERSNPYSPGAGLPPPYLAGRAAPTAEVDYAGDRIQRADGASPLILTGLRGMGKTVLLEHLGRRLAGKGWLVPEMMRFSRHARRGRRLHDLWAVTRAEIAGMQPVRILGRAKRRDTSWLVEAGIGPAGPTARARLQGSSVGPPSDSADPQTDLIEMATRARQVDVAICLRFDEAQEATIEDLAIIAEVGQAAAQRSLPLLLILTGLPSLSKRLAEAASYATRFPTASVAELPREQAEAALTRPATELGVGWAPDGLDTAVRWSGGVPYHLQEIGRESWAANVGAEITGRSVAAALPRARQQVESAMYRPLWDRASDAERRYLGALAGVIDRRQGAPVAEIMRAIKADPPKAGVMRDRLIEKGLIYGVRYGWVQFTYPGFADYVRDQVASAGSR